MNIKIQILILNIDMNNIQNLLQKLRKNLQNIKMPQQDLKNNQDIILQIITKEMKNMLSTM